MLNAGSDRGKVYRDDITGQVLDPNLPDKTNKYIGPPLPAIDGRFFVLLTTNRFYGSVLFEAEAGSLDPIGLVDPPCLSYM